MANRLSKDSLDSNLRDDLGCHIDSKNYQALFDYAADGVLIIDSNYRHVYSNLTLCRMLGYTQADLIAMHLPDIFIENESQSIKSALAVLRNKPNYFGEWNLKRKDGSTLCSDITVTVMPDGNLIGMARDISLKKKQQYKVERLSRLYASLSNINQTIIWLPTKEELFTSLCKTLVKQAGFRFAWVGWRAHKSNQLIPSFAWEKKEVNQKNLKNKIGDAELANIAFETGESSVINDLFDKGVSSKWSYTLTDQGYRSLAVFPIFLKEKISGVLSVYSDQTDFFQKEELDLLEDSVVNVEFALKNLEREETRKEAELAAHNEKYLSDMMFSSMPGVFYLFNQKGKFVRWNNNFQTMSGYSGEEIGKMHPSAFFPEEKQKLIKDKITQGFTTGHTFVEAPLLTKAGEKIPYFFTGKKLVFDGESCLVGMGVDISQHEETETKLKAIEQNYQELVESANSIILRWNAKGVITFLNTFGQKFFGYKQNQIIGKHVIGTIVPNTDSAGRNLEDLMQKICIDTKDFEQNVNENIKKNGERVWVSWTNKVVLDSGGQLIEILSIGNDITERLAAEKEIKELNTNLERRVAQRTSDLEQALVRAESADKLKSAFLATMSHELRTPLNSIIGFTGIVLQEMAGPINSEQAKQLGMVGSSAKHLLELINDVLDISKIEAGQLEIQNEIVNIPELIEQVVILLKPEAEDKGLVLTSRLEEEVQDINIDRRRLHQVLINLTNNAIKFTDKGGIAISAELVNESQNKVSDTFSPYIKISVIDTGIGIKPSDLDALFKPFHQVDTGLTRMHDGTGLGLAICKKLVNLMGGRISVVSEWSKGSEFTITLPLKVEQSL